jgi:hypothetical protein
MIGLDEPEKVSRLVNLLEREKNKFDEKQNQTTSLYWMIASVLARNESWLDEAHPSEQYNLWKGTLIESDSTEANPDTLLDRIIKLLDQGKCYLPRASRLNGGGNANQFTNEEQKAIESAIKTLENRAKTATGPQKKILDRILAKLAQ